MLAMPQGDPLHHQGRKLRNKIILELGVIVPVPKIKLKNIRTYSALVKRSQKSKRNQLLIMNKVSMILDQEKGLTRIMIGWRILKVLRPL